MNVRILGLKLLLSDTMAKEGYLPAADLNAAPVACSWLEGLGEGGYRVCVLEFRVTREEGMDLHSSNTGMEKQNMKATAWLRVCSFWFGFQ